CRKSPVKPADLIVLAIGVVVSLLGAPHFIPAEDHGYAARDQQNDCKILHLALAQRFNVRIGVIALDSAVPAQVFINAVSLVFPVFLVVLCVIGEEIVQRKTIVTGNEIDAVDGQLAALFVKIGTAGQPARDCPDESRVSLNKSTNVIAIA